MAKKPALPKRARGGPPKAKREAIIHAALAAWNGITSGKSDRWPLWSPVCVGLRLCRDDAMRAVGIDPRTEETPKDNGQYNTAMTRALKDTGLSAIYRSTRKAAIECGGWLKEIEQFREGLRVSPEESDRAKWLNLQHPQRMWLEFSKYQRWDEKDPKEKTFLQLTVKKALEQTDSQLAANLAMYLPAKRLYSIAAGMLDRLEVPMRPVVADALDVPPDSKHDAVLALVDKLGWDASERSRLTDALGFDRGDKDTRLTDALAEIERLKGDDDLSGRVIAGLKDRIAELEAQLDTRPQTTTTTDWATGDEAAKQMAELTARLRNAEAQVRQYQDEQYADANDPIPKEIYKEQANRAYQAQRDADQRIRELEAERSEWRVRAHAELEAQYAGRAVEAERERDEALKARDEAVVALHAAQMQIAAMSGEDGGRFR